MTNRRPGTEPSTSELRHDWLSDRWVIVAPQRTDRPDDFAGFSAPVVTPAIEDSTQAACPFCCGHEDQTPPPLAVYCPDSSTSGCSGTRESWLVRVVPNKFPAVNGVGSLKFPAVAVQGVEARLESQRLTSLPSDGAGEAAARPSSLLAEEGSAIDLFRARQVSGAHEVFIESPLHLSSLTQLDRCTAKLIFIAYRDRLRYWSQCGDIAYAVIFKNVGQDAGASLVHTHSQLIATNMLPTDVRRHVERMELYQRAQGQCLFCSMLRDELEENVRIVAKTNDFVAFCPFASRLPSLVTILPRQHESTFESTSDENLEQLAWLVHRVLRSIEICYPHAAYNYVLHTAPPGQRQSPAFHWRMELFPRLTRVAGFEWGSDCFINPLPPELAAARLRGSFQP